MSREEFELRGEGEPEALEWSAGWGCQFRQRRLQLAGRLCQHRLEEPALGVEVVEQQCLLTPARRAICSTRAPAKPRLANSSRAAAKIRNALSLLSLGGMADFVNRVVDEI